MFMVVRLSLLHIFLEQKVEQNVLGFTTLLVMEWPNSAEQELKMENSTVSDYTTIIEYHVLPDCNAMFMVVRSSFAYISRAESGVDKLISSCDEDR